METELPARLTRAEGRKFAFTVGAAFLVLGGVTWWRGHEVLLWVFGAVGGLLILAGLLVPGQLGPVYRAWMGLALLISKFTTPILMGVVYFAVILPIGVAMRAAGRDPLRSPSAEGGHWARRTESRQSDLTRQF